MIEFIMTLVNSYVFYIVAALVVCAIPFMLKNKLASLYEKSLLKKINRVENLKNEIESFNQECKAKNKLIEKYNKSLNKLERKAKKVAKRNKKVNFSKKLKNSWFRENLAVNDNSVDENNCLWLLEEYQKNPFQKELIERLETSKLTSAKSQKVNGKKIKSEKLPEPERLESTSRKIKPVETKIKEEKKDKQKENETLDEKIYQDHLVYTNSD